MAEKIVVLGAAESGIGAALLAKAKGFEVFVSDASYLFAQRKDILEQAQIPFEEGGHRPETVCAADLIIKSPGIADQHPIVVLAKENNIEVISEIEFAYRFTNAKIIAITGTNGKTTTTLLTYHLLSSAGLSVGLAGNVGKSFAKSVLEDNFDCYVLELSSFQIDGLKTFRANIAALLNITPDHLDRYGYKMENYVASKWYLTKNMQAQDLLICNQDDAHSMERLQNDPPMAQVETYAFDALATTTTLEVGGQSFENLPLRGQHNRFNMTVGVRIAQLLGLSQAQIKHGLSSFEAVPHRIETVGHFAGIQFINDSKATNVEATAFALASFPQKSLIWIVGGIDKGNDYQSIVPVVRQNVKAIVCLGVDNHKIIKAFDEVVTYITQTQNMQDALDKALELAESGDTVLLSPACASFDLFKNFEHRGDTFRQLVQLKITSLENEITLKKAKS